MKKIFLLAISLVAAGTLRAATYNAVSCKEADVQAAYTTEQMTPADGDIILIPAGGAGGACTWATLWTISPANSLTIQGAGALIPNTGCSFAPGSACTTTSGSDQTIITNGESTSNDAEMIFVTIASGKTFRITGVEFVCPQGTNISQNGAWVFSGGGASNSNLRIDHNHFNGYENHWLIVGGWTYGVADHNLVDVFVLNDWIFLQNGQAYNNDTAGKGDKSWADASNWGTSKFFFVENNMFNDDQGLSGNGKYANDCSEGGREVFRYNTFSGHYTIQGHEGGFNQRGCRATEVYNNTDTAGANYSPSALSSTRNGTILVWGNVGFWNQVFTPFEDRAANVNGVVAGVYMCGQGISGTVNTSGTAVTLVSGYNPHPGVTAAAQFDTRWGPPNGSGGQESVVNMIINGVTYGISSCSSTTTCTLASSAGTQTGVAFYVPSIWDANTNSNGYPCLDQPGRGQGDLITGDFGALPQTRINSTLNQPNPIGSGNNAWPRQAIDPMYIWNNQDTQSGSVCVGYWSWMGVDFTDNQDYYQQYGPGCESGSNCTAATCNITTGINQAARAPVSGAGNDTCTPNPQPATTYNTGGAKPGVGWWDTANNTLYVCTATNTWTSYYTPYQYPHPLTEPGSGSVVWNTGAFNYGNQGNGTPSNPQAFTLTNGTTTSASYSISMTGNNPTDFTFVAGATPMCGSLPNTTLTGSLAAQASCSVYVVFTPDSAAAKSGTLKEATSTASVSLTGTGVATSPTISWNPTSLNFGSVPVGTSSAPLSVTLTNTGGSSLATANSSTAGWSLTGNNSSDYAVTTTCGSTLASNASCNFTVTFKPTSNASRVASLTETDSTATNSPLSVPLSGIGTGCANIAIGSYTLCGGANNDLNGSTTTVVYAPSPGGGIFAIGTFCATGSCATAPTQTLDISDNINSPETCFTKSPNSPFTLSNATIPDYQKLYAWYCPNPPAGITSFTVATHDGSSVADLEIDVAEFKSAAISSPSSFESVDTGGGSGGTPVTSASLSTSGATTQANDLIVGYLFNCGAVLPAAVGSGFTGVVVNPAGTPGVVLEAKSVNTTGTQTVTDSWTGSGLSGCGTTNGSNDTWLGVVVPLKGLVRSATAWAAH